MLSVPDDSYSRAFDGPEWRAAVEALREAAGVSVFVSRPGDPSFLGCRHRCAYCRLGLDPEPEACFVKIRSGKQAARAICSSGLASLTAPISLDGQLVALVTVAGFITSTRERRALYESATAGGLEAEKARRAITSVPVIARKQADAFLRIMTSTAATVAECARQKETASQRLREMRSFIAAGHNILLAEEADATVLESAAEEAVAMVGGHSSAILRCGENRLETVAATPDWPDAVGTVRPIVGTQMVRMMQERRPLLSHTAPDRHLFAVPLTVGSRLVGMLQIAIEGEVPDRERLASLGRFAQLVAVALDRDDERRRVERATAGYRQLSALAATLGAATTNAQVVQGVLGIMKKAFHFDVCGVLLAGWGRDSALVLARPSVPRSSIPDLLRDLTGRDPLADPFKDLVIESFGRGDSLAALPDWATTVTPLSAGEITAGWIFAARADGGRYRGQDSALLEGVAAHAGPAFARAALFERVQADHKAALASMNAGLHEILSHAEEPAATSLDDAMRHVASAQSLLVAFDSHDEYSA